MSTVTVVIFDFSFSSVSPLYYLIVSLLFHSPDSSHISLSVRQAPLPATSPASSPTSPSAPSASPAAGAGSDAELPRQRPSRVSLRKQTSVVHANLEENYDAVTASNHEALLQLLDQVRAMAGPRVGPGWSGAGAGNVPWGRGGRGDRQRGRGPAERRGWSLVRVVPEVVSVVARLDVGRRRKCAWASLEYRDPSQHGGERESHRAKFRWPQALRVSIPMTLLDFASFFTLFFICANVVVYCTFSTCS